MPPSKLPPSSTSGIFFGWWIVVGSFLILATGFGIAYSFAAFFPSLQKEFGASRAETSLVFSFASFLFFGLGALSGPLCDRLDPRKVLAFGMVTLSAGLILASQAQSLWLIYVAFGLGAGIGVGFLYVPAVSTVQRWFVKKRGMASGIAVAGVGVGTLAIAVLAAYLIEIYGWRMAYMVLAVLPLTIGLVAAALFVQSPDQKGLLPDGEEVSSQPDGVSSYDWSGDATYAQAVKSRAFAFLYIAGILNALAVFIPFVHMTAYAVDHGIDKKTGALFVGLIGLGSILGRVFCASSADRWSKKHGLAIMYFGMGAAMIIWWGSVSVIALGAFAIIFGVFYGGMVALIPALMADYFGGRNAGSIIGALYTCVAIGALCGPPLAGLAYDMTQTYDLAIWGGIIACILSAAFVWAAPHPKR